MEQQEKLEELYTSVLDAFKEYNGVDNEDYEEFEDIDI